VRLFLGGAAEVRRAVQGQELPRSVQGWRRCRRGLASLDQHRQRRSRHQGQHAHCRQTAVAARGREVVDPVVESWGDILGPQALDLALLGAFMAFALVGFFRKSVRLKYATLVAAVGYMGFGKSRLGSGVALFALAARRLAAGTD